MSTREPEAETEQCDADIFIGGPVEFSCDMEKGHELPHRAWSQVPAVTLEDRTEVPAIEYQVRWPAPFSAYAKTRDETELVKARALEGPSEDGGELKPQVSKRLLQSLETPRENLLSPDEMARKIRTEQ